MATQHADLFGALAGPFPEHQVKTRDAPGGRRLSYITPAMALNRLDEAAGPENVRITYREVESRRPDGPAGVVCTIAIRVGGDWIERSDVGGYTVMKDKAGNVDHENTVKTAYSDALKRAASAWGIGRYLRNDGFADFGADPSAPDHNMHGAGSDAPPPRQYNDPPRSGRALYAWSRDMEQDHDVAMVKYLQNWGKVQEFPNKMIDWDADQVARAYEEGSRKLAAVQGPASSPPPEDPEALRRALKRMISTIARVETNREEIAAPDCIRTVARLDALVPESLRIPGEIDACGDPARLRAYIDAATRRHAALQAAQSESAA